MERTARVFVMGIRDREGEAYLDCIADYCGRCELRLRREKQARQKQREQLQPFAFAVLQLYAPTLSTHIVIRVERVEETFFLCRSEEKRMLLANAVFELAECLTGGCAEPELLPSVLRAMQAAEYSDTDPRIILIRSVYCFMRLAGHSLSFERCGACGHGFISLSRFYFNPIEYRMECSCCAAGDATFLEKSTFFHLKEIVSVGFEKLEVLTVSDGTLDLLLYQFHEAVVEKYGILPDLERATVRLKGLRQGKKTK